MKILSGSLTSCVLEFGKLNIRSKKSLDMFPETSNKRETAAIPMTARILELKRSAW